MRLYENRTNGTLSLDSENGKPVLFTKGEKKALSDFFKKHSKYLLDLGECNPNGVLIVAEAKEETKSEETKKPEVKKPEAKKPEAKKIEIKKLEAEPKKLEDEPKKSESEVK